jgi:hypothetical protein
MLKICLMIGVISLGGCFSGNHEFEEGKHPIADTRSKDYVQQDFDEQTATLIYRLEQSGAFHHDQGFSDISSLIITNLSLAFNGSAPKARIVRNPSVNAFVTPHRKTNI